MKNYSWSRPRQLSTSTFVRDRFTWFAYLLLGYYTYLQASIGSLIPFLRDSFHLSYAQTSLPVAAFASGMILIGLCGSLLIRLWQRPNLFWIWCGALGMALGTLLLLLSQQIAFLLMGAFIMGLLGALLQFVLQATLAEHHGAGRAIALTEANMGASVGAGLAPLFIGTCVFLGLGWRSALLLMLVLLGVIALRFYHLPTNTQPSVDVALTPGSHKTLLIEDGSPHQDHAGSAAQSHVPAVFWFYWSVLVCSVAIEWSITVWGALFLQDAAAIQRDLAVTMMSLFFIAEIIGRFIGSRLVRRFDSSLLLMLSLAITTLGFFLFWLAPSPSLHVVGLMIAGFGIANLYPLTLAVSLGAAPHHTKTASAYLSCGTGLAVLSAPIVFGQIASTIGIQHAYVFVLCLLFLTIGFVVFAQYRLRRPDPISYSHDLSA